MPSAGHIFGYVLNNRVLFHNNRYCGLDKKAVPLHPIKNALFSLDKK